MIRAVRRFGSFVVAFCLTIMIPAQVRAWARPLGSEERAALRQLARGQSQTPHPTDAAVAARQALVQRLLAAETDAQRSALLDADKSLLTIDLARLLIEQGGELLRQQNYHKALPILWLAVQIAERVGDKSVMASVLIVIGNAYRGQRMVDEAKGAYRQALALWESLNNQAGIATAQVVIGVITAQYGNIPLGMEHLQKGLAIFERLNDRPRMAETNYFIGELHRVQRRFDPALEVYHKALSLHETLNNKTGMIQTLNGIRLTHTAQGKDDLARETQQKILALNEEMRSSGQGLAARQALVRRLLAAETDAQRSALLDADKSLLTGDLGRSLSAGVSELMQQHDYSKALPLLQPAAKISEGAGDKPALANTLMTIGDVYRGQEMTGEAREHYLQSLTLQEMMKNASAIAQLHTRLGWVSNQHDSRGQALWHFRKAIEASDSIGNKTGANVALTWIGWTHTKFGRYDQAREALEQARSYFEKSGNRADLRVVMHALADLYVNQGDFEQARQYAEQTLALAEEFGSTELAAMERQVLGNIEQLRGNYPAALEHYQKTVAEREAVGASLSALDALQRLAETYYRQGNYQEALHAAERAVAIARPIDFPLSSHVGQTITGKARLALNQPAQARLAFDEAIAIIERSRSQLGGGEDEAQHFFADKISPYHEMVALLVAQRQNADALAYAERAKGRTLLDVLRGGRGDIVRAMTADEKVQEQRLRNDLILLNAELIRKRQHQHAEPTQLTDLQTRQQKARQAFENFQAGLYVAHPELKIQRGETPFLKAEEITALLPDSRSALLEFVVTDKKAFLFIITKSSPGKGTGVEVDVYPLTITAKDLGARAEAFRQHLAKRNPEFSAAARGLYDLLLKPAAAQLHGKSVLVIVPDGPLWELPFHALRSPANRFLIEDCAISYAPSLTVLREMAKTRKKSSGSRSTLLALGNPALGQETVGRAKLVLMDERFDPLPDAEAQVKTLGRLYGQQQSKIYTGEEAREERAKAEAGNYRILHLATHGVLNDASPMYSHLLLSQAGEPGNGSSEDGLLEAWELLKLDLNADLVVLSACETARGRVGAGEGVIGLTWALFVAGCPRTVVSQWKVESASTTELMVEFHRQLKARMQNPKSSFGAAQSLRAAALKMLRGGQYQHPFWWAGFVVVGEGF